VTKKQFSDKNPLKFKRISAKFAKCVKIEQKEKCKNPEVSEKCSFSNYCKNSTCISF